MKLILTLGNQLFKPSEFKKMNHDSDCVFFMREDRDLCTYFQFHKHKIILFLSAMRNFKDELGSQKLKVHYEPLESTIKTPKISYELALADFIKKNNVKSVQFFEIEDKFFESRILNLFKKLDVEYQSHPSPMFLTSREAFSKLFGKKKPFMKTFYEWQRKRLKILVTQDLKPLGDQWSFDVENRFPLPLDLNPPNLSKVKNNQHTEDVKKVVDKFFSNHPGSSKDFWLPTTRSEAQAWLIDFLKNRLENFGPYEDALAEHSDFVFHSVLTPFMNVGLLTPQEVIATTLKYADKNKIPMPSLEGFIRQIIGWREFIRGIYQEYSEIQEQKNFWNHKRKLSSVWYTDQTGLPQLDISLKKVLKFGYAHHIERLMVFGNLMLLLGVDPKEAHKWFMEMFIDSSDWVMGPNVYGMALFSDGGLFATKPYICGSNYWRKMSKAKAGDWCDGVDGLYWHFIGDNLEFFKKNPRLSMMARTFEKMDPTKKKHLRKAADQLIQQLTVE